MAAPLFIPFIASMLSWVFREVVVKFVVFIAVFSMVSFLVPIAVSYLGGFISPSSISGAFGAIDSGVWFVLKFFRLNDGVPLIVSAYVSRFLIRRLPLIG
jgi:hypothetical protein